MPHTQPLPFATTRIRGLDTLRALAILLVLMSHYAGFVSRQQIFGFVGEVGRAGVDLFFVLSGYLIGNQICAAIARGEALALKTFFARRLLRTLPNYYVLLAVYYMLPSLLNGSSVAPLWQFLTFTQNFGLQYGQTFTHSWSLCVEEQFYLILPLLAWLLVKLTTKISDRKYALVAAWGLLVAAILGGMAFRGYAVLDSGKNAFSQELYYSSFARFDELLPGVALAMIKNFHDRLFARLMAWSNALLAAGAALAGVTLYLLHGDDMASFAVTTLGYSLLAMGFALLVCSALSPRSLLNKLPIPGAASMALWSYAVYLAHKPIFMLLAPVMREHHISTTEPLNVALVFAAGIGGGWLLYKLVESPFMRLRERWYPARAKQPAREQALQGLQGA